MHATRPGGYGATASIPLSSKNWSIEAERVRMMAWWSDHLVALRACLQKPAPPLPTHPRRAADLKGSRETLRPKAEARETARVDGLTVEPLR
jgi:hypothetical protein